jgi:hypothetical protein
MIAVESSPVIAVETPAAGGRAELGRDIMEGDRGNQLGRGRDEAPSRVVADQGGHDVLPVVNTGRRTIEEV